VLDDVSYLAVDKNEVGLLDGYRSGLVEDVLPSRKVVQC